jgi:PAS domain S-box-containing protein
MRLAIIAAALILPAAICVGLTPLFAAGRSMQVGRAALAVLLLGVFAAALLWWGIARQLVALQGLLDRVRRLSQDPVQFVAQPVYGSDEIGELAFCFDTMLDAQLSAQSQARVAQAELQDALDCCTDAFFIFDKQQGDDGVTFDFRLRYLNASALSLLKWESRQVVGHSLSELLPNMSTGAWFDKLAGVAAGNLSLLEESELDLPGAPAQWVQHQAVPIAGGVALTMRNISALKRDEIELRKSRGFLQSLIEYLPVLIFAKSFRPENRDKMIVWNKTAEHVMGYSAEQVVGRNNHEIFPSKVADTLNALDRQMLADPRVVVIPEFPYRRPDGALRYLQSISVPLFSDNGQVDYILGIVEDITVRRAQELALRNQQAEMTAVIDALPLGLFRTDAGGNVIYANKVFERMAGLDSDELTHYGWQKAIHQDDRQRVAEEWADAGRHERPFQSKQRFARRDGSAVWTSVKADLVRVGDNTRGYVCIAELVAAPAGKTEQSP